MATIRDVAEKAGVSIATVSRVLNKKGSCSAQTEKRVYQTVRELGYAVNLTAKRLKTGRTGNIGITVKPFHFLYWPGILETAMVIFHSQRFTTEVLLNTDLDECRKRFRESRFDGLLLIEPERNDRALREFIDMNYNFVLLGGETDREDVNLVEIDYFQGGYDATKKLLSLGHRDILFIEDNPQLYFTQEIKRGFQLALDENGIQYREDLLVPGESNAIHERELFGFHRAAEYLKSASFSAILATDDRIASGIMKASREAGVRIPADLSIVGFGDMSNAPFLMPPLTTIHTPAAQMGELGAEILVNNIKRNDSVVKRVKLRTQLILRESHRLKSK
jgi:LacI family transcriptional regulator